MKDPALLIIESYLNEAGISTAHEMKWSVDHNFIRTEPRIDVICEFPDGRVGRMEISTHVYSMMIHFNSPRNTPGGLKAKSWEEAEAEILELLTKKVARTRNSERPDKELPEWELTAFGEKLLDDLVRDVTEAESTTA